MTGTSGRARACAIDFHTHVIVPEVYAVAAQHNIFSQLPTDPGVTDEMRRRIKDRAATVLERMSDMSERIAKMDAMGVDVQVLSASLVHQGLEWADAQTSMRLARTTNDWIAKAVASHPARLIGLGTLPLHMPALAVTPLSNGYPRSVIFPASELMTVVDMGPRGSRRKINGGDAANRGVGETIFTPAFTSVAYTDEYQAELVSEELKYRGYRTIGWVGSGAMPHRFVTRIESDLAGKATFVDATEFVDRLKAIKSVEERDLIRKAAAMQDEIFNRLLEKIRPGITDNDITALAQYEGRVLGSEQGLFLGSSAPLGQASRFFDRHLQARTLKPGEHFTLLIENNGPGGFYTEIARTVVLGKASNELIDGFESMKEAQAHTLRLLKPGASCTEIAQSHDDYMRSRNLPPELRLYCHGQGYDLVERPLIRCDETMRIEEHMNIAVHPGYETASIFAVICDNYLIESGGPGACLHHTPKQVFEI